MNSTSKPSAATAALFELGQVVATPGALNLLEMHGATAATYIQRHHAGDWGDLDAEDSATNAAALKNGGRIFSAYTLGSDRLWLITEATDDRGQRSSTCLLLREEY